MYSTLMAARVSKQVVSPSERDSEPLEKALHTLWIAQFWRVRDFDGVLEFVGEQRDEATFCTSDLNGDAQIAIFSPRDDVVRQRTTTHRHGSFERRTA